MADVLLKEWLVKGHGTEYMLVSADAMDMLFEDLYQTLAVAPTIIEDEQLHKQIVEAALVRAADGGWKFSSVPPWVDAKEAMEFRCAQWLLRRMSKPAQKLFLTKDMLAPILAFLVKHRPVQCSGPRQFATSSSHTSAFRLLITHTWDPRYHYELELQQAPDGEIIASYRPASPCSNVQCKCCRAHNREDWPSGCTHCVEGWVLSCVSKSWWSTLKTLSATWHAEAMQPHLLQEASMDL